MVDRVELAKRYIEKQNLLGIDTLDIEIESRDIVRLVGVNYNGKDKVLRIPSFITDIRINYVDYLLSGSNYTDIIVEGDIKDLSTLCSEILSERVRLDIRNCKSLRRLSNLFRGAKNLKSVEIVGLERLKYVTDISYMYLWCGSLEDSGIDGVEMDNVRSISHLFKGCKSLRYIDISNIKTSGLVSTKICLWVVVS